MMMDRNFSKPLSSNFLVTICKWDTFYRIALI